MGAGLLVGVGVFVGVAVGGVKTEDELLIDPFVEAVKITQSEPPSVCLPPDWPELGAISPP